MVDSTNTVKIFENEQFGQVRTIEHDGEPWFVGKDIAVILNYSNPRKALLDHVDAEDRFNGDGVTIRDSIGREQHPTIINESGLYSLILSSKLPTAKEFKRWVTSEILPTIRKTGGYVANDDQFVATYLPFADEATKALFRATLEVVNQQNRKIAADAPKVDYYDALIDRGANLSLRDTGKELGLGQNKFINRLVDDKFLYRNQNNKLCAYSEYMEKGYFAMKEAVNHATNWAGVQTLVTPKGRDFFRRKYGTLQ